MATPIDVVVFQCHKKFSDGKLVKSCVIYLTKKNKIVLQYSVSKVILHIRP